MSSDANSTVIRTRARTPCSIDILPNELLSAVLQIHVKEDLQPKGFKAAWASRTRLMMVCRLWSDIILSTPRIWSSIAIHLRPRQDPPVTRAIQCSFDLTAQAPIEVTATDTENFFKSEFIDSHNKSKAITTYRSDLVDMIASHIHHCAKLEMRMYPELASFFHAIPLYSAQFLRDINITFFKANRPTLEELLLNISSIPDLRRLCWSTDSPASLQVLLGLKPTFFLNQLTRLNLTCPMTSQEMLLVMRQCTSATEMKIIMQHSDQHLTQHQQSQSQLQSQFPGNSDLMDKNKKLIVRLHNLFILDLTLSDGGYHILRQLDLPNIQMLRLKGSWWKPFLPGQDLTEISYYLSNSHHSLKVLRVQDMYASPNQLPTFFSSSHITSIPIVELWTLKRSEDVIRSIQKSLEKATNVRFKSTADFSYHVLVTMGWGDYETYSKFKDGFMKGEGYYINSSILS